MKLCRICGAPMDDEATFYPMCGAKANKNSTNEETTVLNQNEIPSYASIPQEPKYPKQKRNWEKVLL